MERVISGEEAKRLLQQGAKLIDVRSESEFHQGAQPGALNIPLNNLSDKAKKLDSSVHLIVYCRTGWRSAQAQELLNGLGFKNVYNAGALSNLI